MPLSPVTLPVRFNGGLETKLDEKVVPLGRFIELRDSVFQRGGTAAKRYGNEKLAPLLMGGANLPAPIALGRRDLELLSFSEDKAASYVVPLDRWASAGDTRSVIVETRAVAKTGTNQTLATCAVNDGVALYAWEDSAGGVWYALLDDETGRALVSPTQVSTTSERPHAVAVGDSLQLLYVELAPREIRSLRWLTTAPEATPEQRILITDLSGPVPVYDVDADETKGVIVWATPSQIGVAYLHSSGVLGGSGVGLPTPVYLASAVVTAVSVALETAQATETSRHVAVAWVAASSTVTWVDLDHALAASFAIRSLVVESGDPRRITCCYTRDLDANGARPIWLIYEMTAAAAQNRIVNGSKTSNYTAASTITESFTQRGQGLGSKAFRDGDDVYVATIRDTTLYRTYFVQRARGKLVVARMLPGLAAGTLSVAHLPSVWADENDARRRFFPATYVTDVESSDGSVFTEKGIRRVDLDFDSDEAFRSVQLGATTYIAGGLLQAYDGERVCEAGFHYGIDAVDAPTLGTPTGTGIAPGTRNYRFVLESILANGEVERGPVSAPITVEITGTVNKKVTCSIPTYRLTAKRRVRIGVYRTLDGDPAAYYRVTSLDPTTAGQVNGYVANDTTVDAVTFVDEMTDDTLETKEPLYTNGGIVENDPLASARMVAAGKRRVFIVDDEDVFFSQELAEGYAVELSPALRMRADPFGGPLSGVIVLDDLLVICRETALYAVGGPGPFANPDVGGGWTAVELITSDVGCVSPDSLGYTPVGVVFQSKKGIHLLGRDRSVRYIGAPVERYTDPAREGQSVVATTLIEDRHEIRLLMSSGESLLYDYEYDAWSSSSLNGEDAVLVGGVYHHLKTDGTVWRETIGEYADGTVQIRPFSRSPWLKLAELLPGFQRIWRLVLTGEYRSPHQLRVRAFFDYEPEQMEEWVISPANFISQPGYGEGLYGAGNYGEGGAGTPSRRYQVEIDVYRLCQAVQFTFEFLEAYGVYGAAGELTEMTIRGGVVHDHYPQSDARRA
jgi:hypothetical protein